MAKVQHHLPAVCVILHSLCLPVSVNSEFVSVIF